MFPVKVLFVFATIVVQLQADDESEKNLAIFRECAEANGLKKEDHKKGEDHSGPVPVEMLCTIKCSLEKKGLLSEGKFDVEEIKKDLIRHKYPEDKMNGMLDCIKGIEISECSDMEKLKVCSDTFGKVHY